MTSDVLAVLPDDRARIAADERVAPDVFAALDGFEEERFALPADFAVGRERRFQIGEDAARDGNEISLRGELQKFIKRRRIHCQQLKRFGRAGASKFRRPDARRVGRSGFASLPAERAGSRLAARCSRQIASSV